MTKLRLSMFAIMILSLIMGTSMIQADAAKPEVVFEYTNVDLCTLNADGKCFTDPSTEPICGVTGAVIVFDVLIIQTDYGNDKFKIVKTIQGDVYDLDDNSIGVVDSTTTTQGFYEGNGAKILKTTDKINCNGGVTDEFIHTIMINNHGKN